MGTSASRGSTRIIYDESSNTIWIAPRHRRRDFRGDCGRRSRPVVRDPTPPPSPPPTANPLKVQSVDLKSTSNKFPHYTYEIEDVPGLVVRRGEPFILGLQLGRPYDKTTDKIILEFKTGDSQSFQQRTRMMVALDGSNRAMAGEWKAEVDSEEGNTVSVSVTASAKALVGKYSLAVHTEVKTDDGPAKSVYKESQPLYLLFNAWCETDQVFMEDKDDRMEYVMNERGYIWYGNYRQMGKRPWAFSQFEKGVFEAVMFLLDSQVQDNDRGNAVVVSRTMSAAVNSSDDGGVLTGKWGGDYAPYTRPTKWAGSEKILEEYYKTKKAVRYGQCWVFSGVLTTVLRCLGIPARSVTNFASAHDTDISLTIDKYMDEDGEDLGGCDSVWNFHVWNEAWMVRPDLPPGYGGWQAVDATPQETSEGLYQTGPCPVNAIKQGHVYYPHDGQFIFAEVNADRIYWKKQKDGEVRIMKIRRNAVGKFISTKAVGKGDRVDLTNVYKHPEGCDAERAAVKAAMGYGTKPDIYDVPDMVEDVEMSIQLDDLFIGSDFEIGVLVVNKSSEERNVSVCITVQVVYYTGVLAGKLKTEKEKLKLEPGEERKVSFHIDADEYLEKLVDQSALKVFLHGHVTETGQALADEEDFRLRTPYINMKLVQPEDACNIHMGTPVEVELSLTNPLKKTLTNCEISVEGSGLMFPKDYKPGNVNPGGTLSQKVNFKPWRAGERTLVATFESDQLDQVTGELDVTIMKPQ